MLTSTQCHGRLIGLILAMPFPLPPTSHPPPCPRHAYPSSSHFLALQELRNSSLSANWCYHQTILCYYSMVIKKKCKMSNYCYYCYHHNLTVSCNVSASNCVNHLTCIFQFSNRVTLWIIVIIPPILQILQNSEDIEFKNIDLEAMKFWTNYKASVICCSSCCLLRPCFRF